MGQEFGQSTVGMACFCSTAFGGSAGKAQRQEVTGQLGAGILWRFLHSGNWCWVSAEMSDGMVTLTITLTCHCAVGSFCIGQFGISQPGIEVLRPSVPRSQGGSAWNFYDLASEVTQYHFCHWVKQSQAPPRSKGSGIECTSWWRSSHVLEEREGREINVLTILGKCKCDPPYQGVRE